MKKRLLHLWALALCLGLLAAAMPAALAEDCFTLDVDALDLDRLSSDDYISRHLSSSAQGIRVRMRVSDSSENAAYVRLTLTRMDSGTLLFDKEYGYVSGTFDSGAIYLPYGGEGTTPYLITLYVGEYGYGLPFMHTPPRLTRNSACTVGVRLREMQIHSEGDWMMGTMLDLNALRRSGRVTVDVCASNSYLIGTASITLSGESLCVELGFDPSAGVEVERCSLYVVTDCSGFHSAPAREPGEWVDVSGASSALVYLPMEVSYDPAGLPAFFYDHASVRDQLNLWNENCASGQDAREASPPAWDGGSSDGWDSGWNDDGWQDSDYGWDDEWSSDAPGWQG